jgi:hypothetical protein
MGSLQILGVGIPDDGDKAKAKTAMENSSASRGWRAAVSFIDRERSCAAVSKPVTVR